MIKHIRKLLLFMPVLGFAAISPQALAVLQNSEHSVTVIPAEGNGRCSDYGANDFVKEMGASVSCQTDGRTVTGPDGETAVWTYDCETGVLGFERSTIEIDYAITKSSRNITWYPYGSETVKDDSGITNQDPETGEPLQMASFALCYGLPSTDNNVAEPESYPDCNAGEGAEINGWLSGISCGDLADGTVVTLWRPTLDDDELFQCVCNEGGGAYTVDCNPTGDSGDGDLMKACYSKLVGQPKATTVVEFDADPITCTTSGGTRRCKCVDNPFTSVNECL